MKQKDIIFIITSALIVVAIWIIFEIIHSSTTSTVSEKLNLQVTPIKSEFDLETIQSIKERKEVKPLYGNKIASATPTLTPSPSPAASPSAVIIEEESQASEGGELLP